MAAKGLFFPQWWELETSILLLKNGDYTETQVKGSDEWVYKPGQDSSKVYPKQQMFWYLRVYRGQEGPLREHEYSFTFLGSGA